MPRIIDVVEAPNQGPNEMVARVPEVGSGDFRLGSQVIVRESQVAVFYRDGKSLDTFGPGRHTITTANLPMLSGLLNFLTGGNNVFTAEVYFVNMREFTDLKWGTPQPISLRDSELGYARVRGFGQYTMQVSDPKRFVDQIVGTQGLYQTSQIEDYLRNSIISRMTDVLGENMTSIFDLPKLIDEMGAAIKAKVQDSFAAMGIALKQFMIVSITPTDETAKAIDERASMGAIGNMDAYMKYQAAKAMSEAAKNPSGGGAAAGVGLGAGMGMGAGMAGMIANAMNSASTNAPQAPSARCRACARRRDDAGRSRRLPQGDARRHPSGHRRRRTQGQEDRRPGAHLQGSHRRLPGRVAYRHDVSHPGAAHWRVHLCLARSTAGSQTPSFSLAETRCLGHVERARQDSSAVKDSHARLGNCTSSPLVSPLPRRWPFSCSLICIRWLSDRRAHHRHARQRQACYRLGALRRRDRL